MPRLDAEAECLKKKHGHTDIKELPCVFNYMVNTIASSSITDSRGAFLNIATFN